MGRPFKGAVEEMTKEPNVPERRSVLRGFKKFYAKREFIDANDGDTKSFYEQIFIGLENEDDIKNLKKYMDICKNT